MTNKMIYEFGKKTDGNATMRALLGGKGGNYNEILYRHSECGRHQEGK